MEMRGMGRGGALLEGGARFGGRPSLLSRLFAGGFAGLIDRIDAGIASGSLGAILPDGSSRVLGGRAPGFEAQVILYNWRALLRLATSGSIGWYQAWEAGEWESADPVTLFALFAANAESLGDAGRAKGACRLATRFAHWSNRNTRAGSRRNVQAHYDLGNDFYSAWLDPTMSYSSAMFDGEESLEAGQRHKWQGLAERLGDPRDVLEIGCGWGALSAFLAGRGSEVTAISLSGEQLDWARRHHGGKADFRQQDYRDVTGQFDAIVSVEMVEAVGRDYWPAFFDCIARCLRPGGRAAIQYIAMKDAVFDAYARNAEFIQAYIFPGGMLVSESEFQQLAAQRGLGWEDQRNFPLDYARTLQCWRERFDAAHAEGRLPSGFDERFVRLWRYYLMYCEGGFRAGTITVGQVTLTKG